MYKPHQIVASDKALALLRANGFVGIFGLPRTGKTRTAIRTANLYGSKNVLIFTKKAAIPGWRSELDAVAVSFQVTVTNYEQAKHIKGDFDLVIIDEAHNLGTRGKATLRVKEIRALCYDLPMIGLTGTPTIETPLGIYHQWCVTKYSPFKHKNFYAFFNEFGIPKPIWIGGRSVESYKVARDTLEPVIERFVVRINQDDAGITHKAQDQIHTVKLKKKTQKMIANIMEEGVHKDFIFDTEMGVRTAVHQIEAGAVLYDDNLLSLKNTEVVDYLLKTFGDSADVAFFCHFRSTRQKLDEHFTRATVLSSIAHAEGYDASHFKHMVVVNTGYSGSKWSQLRNRLVNINRTSEAIVHIITTDGGISREVYEVISNKDDFNLSRFRALRKC